MTNEKWEKLKTGAKEARLERLFQLGFDQSESYGVRWNMDTLAVRCSQCQAMVINGTPTHETGCPNAMHECHGCNEIIPLRQKYCEGCN